MGASARFAGGPEEESMARNIRAIAGMMILLASIFASILASSQVNRTGPYNNSNLRLEIQRAIYGYNGKGNDVTNRVRSQIRNNRIDMEVNNDTMGGDPNHGNKKNLKVVFTYGGGKSQTRFVNEHDTLRIP
jgi:hypothetical protein